MEKKPKVLVGCPTSEHKGYALERYVEGVKALNYEKFDVLLVDNSKSDDYSKKIKSLGLPVVKGPYSEFARQRIIDSRNILRQKVLNEGYDYFFSLEQDVIPPRNVIQRLLSHSKKIVTGIYFRYEIDDGVKSLVPVLWKKFGKEKLKSIFEKEVLEPRLMEVGACGLGCVLIHRDVLEKVMFKFDKNYESFDDMWFCRESLEKGFKIFADTSVKCKHLVVGWSWKDIKQ